MKHFVTAVDELSSHNIGLKVLSGSGAKINTTTENGYPFFGIFAALVEFERELIAERTHAGLAAERAQRQASSQDGPDNCYDGGGHNG